MRQSQREVEVNALASNVRVSSKNHFSKNNIGNKNTQYVKNKNDDRKITKRKPGKCNFCHKPGHWAAECWNNPESKQYKFKNSKVSGEERGEALISEALASVQKTAKTTVEAWYMDTGASDHMTHKLEWFINYTPMKDDIKIKIGDGETISGKGRGSINISAFNGEKWTECHLSNVLYVPKLKYNLFSGGVALDKNLTLEADKRICKFIKEGKTIAVGERQNKLFEMKIKIMPIKNGKESADEYQACIAEKSSFQEWHQKLAHQNYTQIKKILKNYDINPKGDDKIVCGTGKLMESTKENQNQALLYLPEEENIQFKNSQAERKDDEQIEENLENLELPNQLSDSEEENEKFCTPEAERSTGIQLRDRSKLNKPKKLEDYEADLDNVCDYCIVNPEEPLTFQQAVNGTNAQEWKQAMEEEMDSLKTSKVWELVEVPKNSTIVENKWVYKLKTDTNGNIQKFRARLVAKGFSQREGIDFNETFSPVVRFDSIRILLTVIVQENLVLKQFDVKTAFLNGDIEEVIYMKQPTGFNDGTTRVCKLLKSLYGLRQSSRCWNQRIKVFLTNYGLKQSKADPCIYMLIKNNLITLLVSIYVDDGLVAGIDEETVNDFLCALEKEFDITSGDADTYLGLQIERQNDGSILLRQSAYTRKILNKFNLEQANALAIPADPHQQLNVNLNDNEKTELTTAPYREAVGSLLYLSKGTRPDISFSVSMVSRYMEKPTKLHWNAVKRIMKYLKGTIDYGLHFNKKQKTLSLCGYSDADFAGDIETRKSTTGFIVIWSGCVVSWCSQRQSTVATSTTYSEYIAAFQTVKEIVWLLKLIGEIYPYQNIATTLYIDNQSTLELIKNPVLHKRSKHIDVQYHYIREQYDKKVFQLKYINTKEQPADILTKPLERRIFEFHRNRICSKLEEDS